MPAFGHLAVGLVARRAVRDAPPKTVTLVTLLGVLASIAPDLDILGLPFHPPLGVWWGHRGASHSLLAALAISAGIGLLGARSGLPFRRFFLLSLGMVLSHLLLDCLNVGSLGVPWLWPLVIEPFGSIWQPIPALVRLGDLFTWDGVRVFLAEAAIFAPVALWSFWPVRQDHPSSGSR